jgi:hypothetical protein
MVITYLLLLYIRKCEQIIKKFKIIFINNFNNNK